MDQDIKHNKKKCLGTSIQVFFEAARGHIIKLIFVNHYLFLQFNCYKKYYAPLLNVRWMLCILFLFLFHPSFKDLQWKVLKPPNKKRKGLIYCSLVIILGAHESSVNNLSF